MICDVSQVIKDLRHPFATFATCRVTFAICGATASFAAGDVSQMAVTTEIANQIAECDPGLMALLLFSVL